MNKGCSALIALIVCTQSAFPQSLPVPPGSHFLDLNEAGLYVAAYRSHTAVRPFLEGDFEAAAADSVTGNAFSFPMLRRGHFFTLRGKQAVYYADPLADFSLGAGNAGNRPVSLDKGLQVTALLSEKISLQGSLLWQRSRLSRYLEDYAEATEVVPGQGYADSLEPGRYGHTDHRFMLSYSPSAVFNLQLGRGKNFFGDGYRSLLLSHNSSAYPFLRIRTRIWRIEYVNLFAHLRDIRGAGGDPERYSDKYGTFHFLGWNIAKWLNVGIFEAVIWQGADSSGVRGYDLNYLNPVIFYRPVEFSLGSPDNALLGMNVKITPGHRLILYGQVILDEFFFQEIRKWDGWSNNKQGVQAGFRAFRLGGVEGLSLQSEINFVRPYTYTHNGPLQNYSNFNEAMAHPLGANFVEAVGVVKMVRPLWSVKAVLVYAEYGADTAGSHFGKDIFQPYPNTRGNRTGQGISTDLLYGSLRYSYVVNPDLNLRLEAGLTLRSETSALQSKRDIFFTAGIRTTIPDHYVDY